MPNSIRAKSVEANLFFRFFGLDAIDEKRHERTNVATSATGDSTSRRSPAYCRACRRS